MKKTNKNLKIVIAAVLLLAMLLPVLAGCDKTPVDQGGEDTTPADQGEVTTPATEETTAPSIKVGEFVALVTGGKAVSRILYNGKGGEVALNAAKELNAVIKEKSGINLSVYSADKAKAFDGVDILVNTPDRPEVIEAKKNLALGDYHIGFYSGALVIVADDDNAIFDAIDQLADVLDEAKAADGSIGVYDQMKLTSVYNKPLSLIMPAKNASSYQKYYNGDESYTVTYGGIDAAGYEAYNADLASRGMKLYTQKEVNGNLFATYTGHDCVITSIFVKHTKELKLITEPASVTALPSLEPELAAKPAQVTPMITQIGLEVSGNTEDYTNGMSYLIRLSDGRFIVIDGGHHRSQNAANMFKVMRVQAPDSNNITVAAWIFTHAHTDHAGMFYKNFSAYSKNVTIERFIFDFPTDEIGIVNTGMNTYINGIKKQIAKDHPNAVVYKAHAGQTYLIGDAKIDILYSFELLCPPEIDENFNMTSLMFSFEMADHRMIFLGDCMVPSSEFVTKMYGNTLKADFVQVGHHGSTGATTELYSLIKPSYVFWPIAECKYPKYQAAAQNSYFKVTRTIKQICVAGDNVWTATFGGGEPVFKMFDNINTYK